MSSQTIVGKLAIELGISDAQLQAGLASAITQSQTAGKKMAAAINQGQATAAKNAWGGNAMGFLNLSRAIDDAQYGLRGVINNVEGIATGFGLGAGVAGAATIAAVAIGALSPALESAWNSSRKFFDGFQDGAERARMSVAGMMGGGFGSKGLSSALKEQADFLMNRADRTDFDLSASRGVVMNQTRYENALANNMRRAVEASALMQQAFRAAADASQKLGDAQRGASAQFDLTTNQRGLIPDNQQLFQAAVDKFGGGDNLRTKLTQAGMRSGMIKSETEQLYGGFARGGINETNKAVELLGLQAERTKVMADGYERMTGQAEELRRIEEDRLRQKEDTAKFIENEQRWLENAIRKDEELAAVEADRERQRKSRIVDRQMSEYMAGVASFDSLSSRRSAIEMNMNRSEILGSAAEVFGRNINAGMEDPQLKELREIKEEIRNLQPLTGLQ